MKVSFSEDWLKGVVIVSKTQKELKAKSFRSGTIFLINLSKTQKELKAVMVSVAAFRPGDIAKTQKELKAGMFMFHRFASSSNLKLKKN